jgi:hypothetical protein
MSFDLSFQSRRTSSELVERKNPLTGKMILVHPPIPLTAGELKAVKKLFKTSRAKKPDEFGCHVVEFEDGGHAEIFASRLATGGCMAAVRGLTPDLLRFLFEMLRAADWVMLPAMEGNPAITSSAVSIEWLSADVPRVGCSSPEDLGLVLTRGVEAWRQYRDKVVGRD